MCGIAGFVGEGSEDVLREMAHSVRHRGPDDSGIMRMEGVGLAFARLAIIDLSPAGHQPMNDISGRYAIVFNGEIYNFKELRHELSAYKFKTRTDTEVILAAYSKWGKNCFSRLDGMFALAIWDKHRQELILARDRLGKKPLYWSWQNLTFAFASELKALWCHPKMRKALSARSLAHYLAREYVPTPHTMFGKVYKLMPASYLSFKDGDIEEKKFWKPEVGHEVGSEEEVEEKFNTLLDAAVKKRLVSDVPLGIFLSGGLDSSTVAYYASRHGRIKTFSVGFKEKSFDESSEAALVASHLGTEHHSEIFSASDALDLVQKIPDVFDEPVADASVLPTMLLSRFTREKVTVALGGDGADELLLGYPTFRAETYAHWYSFVPSPMRAFIRDSVSLLPSSSSYFSLDFKVKKFANDFSVDEKVRHLQWLGSFRENELPRIMLPQRDHVGVTQELIDQWQAEYRSDDMLNQLSHLYLRTYCLDDVLVKVDRTSMHYSLEVRTPFLDAELVSFLLRVPSRQKYSKRLLKKIMRGRLPASIINKKKQGFAAPIAQWLRGPLKELCTDVLSHAHIKDRGLLNADEVDRLVTEHMSGAYDHRKKLWTLIVFQLWYNRWIQ